MIEFLFARANYDGNYEPQLLKDYFGKGVFTFVDVGANYPESSVSLIFEKLGWNGVVIEPQPDCVKALKKTRKCPVVACACVNDNQKNKKLKLWLAGPQSSLDLKAYTLRTKPKKFIWVPTKTLTQICNAHHVNKIDFLSIDTEGTEIEIMKGLDWKKFSPKLILIEDFARDFEKHSFLKSKGYVLFRRTGFNAWYAKPKDALKISLYGRIQLFIKYYIGGPLRNFRRWRHSLPRLA